MWRERLSIPLLSASLAVQVPGACRAAEEAAGEHSPTEQRSSQPAAQQASPDGHPRATAILGREVDNAEGDRLGTLEEIVVDPRTSAILYVVVSSGGTLGIGDKKHAVPWSAVTAGDERVIVGVSKHTFMQTRGFDGDSWPDAANFALAPGGPQPRATPAERGAAVEQESAAPAPEPGAAPTDDPTAGRAAELRDEHPLGIGGGAGLDAARRHQSSASPDGAAEPTPTPPDPDAAAAREAQQASREASMEKDTLIKPLDREHLWSHRASELVDLVVHRGDERIAEVEDLVLDDDRGRIGYALLDLEGTLGAGGRKVLVPWSAMRLNLADRAMSIDADAEAIRQAAFEGDAMPDLDDPQWVERTRRLFGGADSDVYGYSIQTDDAAPRDDPPQPAPPQ